MVLSVRLQSSRIKKKFQDPSEKSQKSHMKGQEYQWCVGLFNYSPGSQQALEYTLKLLREKIPPDLQFIWRGELANSLELRHFGICMVSANVPPSMDFPRKCAAINPRIQMEREDGMPRDPGKGIQYRRVKKIHKTALESNPWTTDGNTLMQTDWWGLLLGNEPDRWAGWLDLMRSNSNNDFVILLYCLKTLQ